LVDKHFLEIKDVKVIFVSGHFTGTLEARVEPEDVILINACGVEVDVNQSAVLRMLKGIALGLFLEILECFKYFYEGLIIINYLRVG